MSKKIEVLAEPQEQVLNLKITCKGYDGPRTLINLLAAIQYNTAVGHSCTIGAFFDGDGADKITIEGLPENVGGEMANACASYGDDFLACVGDHTAGVYNTRWNEAGTERTVHYTQVWPTEEKERQMAFPVKAAMRLLAAKQFTEDQIKQHFAGVSGATVDVVTDSGGYTITVGLPSKPTRKVHLEIMNLAQQVADAAGLRVRELASNNEPVNWNAEFVLRK